MSNVFVTGGTGFIGSHLVEALLERGYLVSMIVRPGKKISCAHPGTRVLEGTLFDAPKFMDELKNTELLFLIAGLTKAKTSREFYEVNAESVKLWLSVAEKHCKKLKRVVLLSTQAATRPCKTPVAENVECAPLTHYGKSKLLGERYALEFSNRLPITILRAPAVYGPRDRDIYFYFRMASRGFLPIVGNPQRKFSAIFVNDLVEAIIISSEHSNTAGEIFFVKGGDHTWQEFSDAVANAVGRKALRVNLPGFVLWFAAAVQETASLLTRKPALLSFEKVRELLEWWVIDDSKFRRLTGFSPRFSLEEAVKLTADWYRQNGWI